MADSPYVVEATAANFETAVLETSRRVPVLVDFWAGWCAPCQMLMPVLAKLADDYAGKFVLAKVDTDAEQKLAEMFGVRSLPTVKLFKNAAVVNEFMGALPESQVRAFLDAHIERDSDKQAALAREALDHGDHAKALQLLRDAKSRDPENFRLDATLIDVLLTQGDIAAAEQALRALPANVQVDPEFSQRNAKLEFARMAHDAPPAAELKKVIANDSSNLDARYQLSARLVIAGDYVGALDELLEILRRNKSFKNDGARKAMLKIFDLLGGKGDVVSRYRPQMAKLLH